MNENIFYKDWKTKENNKLKHTELITKARKEIDLADHLVYVTLPLVDDIKFLLVIIDHIFNASSFAVESMLEQRKYYKKTEAFPRSFNAMIELWKSQIMDKHFEKKHYSFLKKIQEIKIY